MSILSSRDMSVQYIESIFSKTDSIDQYNHLNGKILVNVFFEPSTRTSLSFECAMLRMGGKVITFQKDVSSVNKGESFEDTIRTLSLYGDIIVLRHPMRGMVYYANSITSVPVINAGDGDGEHPTQALIDMYTIYKLFGRSYRSINILFIGDNKNSRTVHSFLMLLNKYSDIRIHFWSYHKSHPSQEIVENISEIHDQDLNDICIDHTQFDFKTVDVIYITRMQKERIASNTSPDIIVNKELLKKFKNDIIVLHPLPRNEELSIDIDKDERIKVIDQMKYGIELRKVLLSEALKYS